MDHIARLTLLALLPLLCGACSTIESRLKEMRPAFDAMPPKYQQLALQGTIADGMPKEGVYIAWGEPDAVSQGSRGSRFFETWHYFSYETVEVGGFETFHRGYVDRRGRRYYYIDPLYSPTYVTRRRPAKWCTFENQRVVAWEAYFGNY